MIYSYETIVFMADTRLLENVIILYTKKESTKQENGQNAWKQIAIVVLLRRSGIMRNFSQF